MPPKATVLLFHVSSAKENSIRQICADLDVTLIKPAPADYSQKLGYLAGITGFARENAAYSGPDFPSEMMVFSGMDSDKVDAFLAAYKKASLPPIGLKAVITAHNIFWSAEQLYRELLKEHMQFTRK